MTLSLKRTGSSYLSVSSSMGLFMILALPLILYANLVREFLAYRISSIMGKDLLINKIGNARTDLNHRGEVIIQCELQDAVS